MHFPRSCLHCETPACVTVCPTGASYKRASDGIVLVDEDKCIGCKLCSWACPYGAREFDTDVGVMKKCTLCVDRIYNDNLRRERPRAGLRRRLPDQRAPFRRSRRSRIRRSRSSCAERGGVDLMPELGYQPTNKYLPPRARTGAPQRCRRRRSSRCRPTAASSAGSTACCRADTMHPAFSVIFFTTATGAGYGLLALLGLLGRVRPDSRRTAGSALVGLGLALALDHGRAAVVDRPSRPPGAGMARVLAMAHRPGCRAKASLASPPIVPAGLFGIGWVLLGRTDGWVAVAGLLPAIGAVVTVFTTGMIYASLKPIAQWHSRFTLPAYLIFSVMTGACCSTRCCRLSAMASHARWRLAAADLARLGLEAGDMAAQRRAGHPDHANSATGLAGGTVRSIEWPHTRGKLCAQGDGLPHRAQARARLRQIAQSLAFALPVALLIAAFALPLALRGGAVGHSPPSRSSPACWSSAGCSSPRRSTRSPSTTAGSAVLRKNKQIERSRRHAARFRGAAGKSFSRISIAASTIAVRRSCA